MKWAFLLIFLLFISGCISEPNIEPITEVQLGDLYDINPDRLEMKIDSNVSITIANNWTNEIRIKLTDLKIIANFKDGTKIAIKGNYEGYEIIPAGTTKVFMIKFVGVPVGYKLNSKPLKLETLISSYDVIAYYEAETTVFWVWNEKRYGSYSKTIIVKDIELDEEIFKKTLS